MPIKEVREKAILSKGLSLNWLAPFYDRLCLVVGLGKRFRETTLSFAALKQGERVLDVGCGTGVLTRMAATIVGAEGRVEGIDIAPKMIEVARENALREGNRAVFKLAAMENLPFEDSSFDCVFSSAMLHHLPPDVKVKGLSEVYRALKPGGRFVVADIYRPRVFWWIMLWPMYFFFHKFTKDHFAGTLEPYFEKSGFASVKTVGRWRGIITFWLVYKHGNKN